MRAIDGVNFTTTPEANLFFAELPRRLHKKAFEAGAYYYIMSGELEGDDPEEMLLARFVADWSIGAEGVDALLAAYNA